MIKRNKIKKWLKDHFTKENIFKWVFIGAIALMMVLIAYYQNKDTEKMNNNVNNVNVVDEQLNKNYYINNDGDIVSNNLFNIPVANYNAGFVVRYYYVSLSGVNSFNISSDNNSGGYAIDFWLNNSVVYTINGNVGQTRTYTINFQYDNISIYINQNNVNLRVMVNSGSTGLPYEPFGTWYKNQSTFNLLKYYSYAELIKNNSVVYTANTLSDNEYRGVNYIDTAINMGPEIDDINYFKLNFSSPVNITSDYVFSIVDFGYTYNIQFYNLDTLVYTLNTEVLSTNDNYRYFYIFKENISFTSIYINNDGTNFYEDSPLISLVSSTSGLLLDEQFKNGYTKGYEDGVSVGYSNGNTNGYNNGYQIGLNEGANQNFETNAFNTLLNSIFSYPINFISNVFNFEFMGINIASVLLFLISVGVVLFVVKRLWK